MDRDYFMTSEEASRVRVDRPGDRTPLTSRDSQNRRFRSKRRDVARASDGNEQLLCSFCGKSQRQVKKLIAGPGVYICDECIDLCNEIIDEELTAPDLARPRQSPAPERHLRRPQRLRRLAGRGEAHALRRGLQPLQARAHGTGRRGRGRTAEVEHPPARARPGAARRCSRRRSRGSSTSRSRSPTQPR